MDKLKQEITKLAREMGIDKIGVTTRERLSDAPPSGDLTYVLPSAKSAISLAVALDKQAIRDFLSKKDQMAHTRDHRASYMRVIEAGMTLEKLLHEKGHEAKTLWPNYEYRKGQPFLSMAPPLSHRYVAVAAGIGWLGWSGNVLTPEYGATVSLLSIVTSAELEPDEPMEQRDSCDKCRLCTASCPSYFISTKEETKVTIAGHTYTHNKKAPNARCEVSCGGANGVRNRESKWSTWSYKVLDLPGPGNDDEFMRVVQEYAQDPNNRLLRILLDAENLNLPPLENAGPFIDRMLFTCGNCMLVCWPKLEDRKENHRLLTTSGRVVRGEQGPVVVKQG
ncbi:MAG: epoxyqueuosine reductase [Chloroflexi bacterium]|nr:epoxyqueuosine reductase [Chloroflexota bacterium]